MPDYEASQLLDEVAPDVDLGEFKDAIVKLSEGRKINQYWKMDWRQKQKYSHDYS